MNLVGDGREQLQVDIGHLCKQGKTLFIFILIRRKINVLRLCLRRRQQRTISSTSSSKKKPKMPAMMNGAIDCWSLVARTVGDGVRGDVGA